MNGKEIWEMGWTEERWRRNQGQNMQGLVDHDKDLQILSKSDVKLLQRFICTYEETEVVYAWHLACIELS